jgi:hypothetical protein
MHIDESKTEQFLSVTQAHSAYLNVRWQLDDALSISGAKPKQSGGRIEVYGTTRTPPPQPTSVVLSPGEDHYELAQECIKLFEAYKRASGR